MKRDFLKIRKRIIVGCLAAAIAVAQPVSSVLQIRIMTDVIQWLRRNLFILQELPVQSHQEKSESQSMEKDQRCLL